MERMAKEFGSKIRELGMGMEVPVGEVETVKTAGSMGKQDLPGTRL
jgi:hypothetical protein